MSDSIESLEEAVKALPENLALRRQLAAALEKAGDADRALAEYDAILTRAAADGTATLGRARCLYEVGRHAEALEAYDAAVARDVSLADAALEGKIRRAKDDPRARYPLKRPDLYKAFGKKVGGGLLLYGPPGCGKTFLARATAGEAGIHFVAVGIEEVLDMWLGQSEKKLHELFKTAREKAPAILFFDEVDSLGGRRSGLRHESYRTLVTQFLSELDGANGRTEGVLVVGATNAPWDVDPAFRRPGRFGEVLFVPPPDLRARVEILKLKLAGKPVAADV